jgi:pimeloyl-ACP methyl ester carboxylesterase
MAPTDSSGDLVIVIPGILGSRLVRREGDRSVTVWDFSIKSLPRVLKEIITHGLVLERPYGPPEDGVEAAGLFNYQWLPGFFGVDDYAPLVNGLRAAIGPNAQQLIEFPYDWRASNRYAAERLQNTALDALTRWKKASGNPNAKLWLVCHSMGGLVARYFCEQLDGARHTRAIVTIGTPHRGSVNALDALANGKRIGPFNLTSLVRSLPSAYELLPLFPVVRIESEDTFAIHRLADFFGLDPVSGQDVTASAFGERLAPLPGLDRGMLKRALEFHARIRGPAEARERQNVGAPYRQHAFFNRRQRTALSARLKGEAFDILNAYPVVRNGTRQEEVSRGDGTVPSFASIPIEWPDSTDAISVGDKHAAMQCAPAVLDAIFNWLRPLDVRALKGGPVLDESVVELNVPAVLATGEELVVEVASLRRMNVRLRLDDAENRTKKSVPATLSGDDRHKQVTLGRPAEGVYRVTAIPEDDPLLPKISDPVLVVANGD